MAPYRLGAVVLALAIALTVAHGAFAVTDYDGDGSTTDDCQPLDPGVHPGAADRPDTAFEDTNCDGIDGDAAKAVFVAPSGNDNGTGSKSNPLQTLSAAISKAKTDGKDVYAAAGTYNEHVALESNVGIYGGYTPGTGARTSSEQTTIQASPEAVLADGDSAVSLQLLTLDASPDSTKSAYGLRAINNSKVLLEKVTATAAAATGGAPGTTPGQATGGNTGGTGADGFISSPNCPSDPPYGTKGTGAAGPGGNGGNGGGGTCGTGNPGVRGFAFGGAQTGGTVGTQGAAGGGTPGGDGGVGDSGTDGAGGTNAFNDLTLGGSVWAAATATPGSPGTPGKGGGGGGGGGGAFLGPNDCNALTYAARGGGGGGGGSGGAGGQAGGVGAAGGGSFGVYVFNSTLVAVDSVIAGGNGGAGGDGGGGGPGGVHGSGGPQGSGLAVCGVRGGNGGHGGDGGDGGDGGPGGGGAGGPSAGIFKAGSGSFVIKGGSVAAGSGGAGGRLGGSGTQVPTAPAAGALPDANQSTTSDFDGDSVKDAVDACPAIAAGAGDANGDGCPDRAPKLGDADGDGVPDGADACPSQPGGATDANGDGCPDNGTGGVDNDGDGFGAALDCNDSDPQINPHAPEIPGNLIDENCDGSAAPFPKIASGVSSFGTATAKVTRFLKLLVKDVPAGGAVELRCRARNRRACTFSAKRLRVRRGTANALSILPRKKRKKGIAFGVGATVEVRITAPNMIGKVVRYRIVKRRFPTGRALCLPPGASRPRACT